MLIDLSAISPEQLVNNDVCLVGSGPAGITLALELEAHGFRTLLLESGSQRTNSYAEGLSETILCDPTHHAPMDDATSRRLGGTSDKWGGRCVPFDPIDFENRNALGLHGWPLSFREMAEYYSKACAYCLCGNNNFVSSESLPFAPESIVPELPDGDVLSTMLERWSLPADFWATYGPRLRNAKNILVVDHATCTEVNFEHSEDEVSSITLKAPNGHVYSVKANAYVLACGGLETTRLLLNSDRVHKGGVGNHSGKLGHYYMGHISGKISRVKFTTESEKTVYGFEKDMEGIYCKRRFTISEDVQKKENLLNFAAWLDNPPLYNPAHGNGIMSLAFVALSTPVLRDFLAPKAIVKNATGGKILLGQTIPHLKNILLDMPNVISFMSSFLYKRYIAKRKIPGFFLPNKNNEYVLHYHAEHAPDYESKVSLSDECNALGVRKLLVDIKFNSITINNVIKCHQIIDSYLQRNSCGRLIYADGDLESKISDQAGDGFHQLGTTRMSEKPDDGVVDANCRIHGIKNLYVASSSVFPTSGQANPTLSIVALSIRLAQFLKKTVLAQE